MSQPVYWVLLPGKRLERDLPFLPAAVLWLRLIVVRCRPGGRGRPRRLCRGTPRLEAALAAVLPRFQILEVVHHENVLGPLLAGLLVVPLLQDQVAFEKHLMALAQVLLRPVRLLPVFAA